MLQDGLYYFGHWYSTGRNYDRNFPHAVQGEIIRILGLDYDVKTIAKEELAGVYVRYGKLHGGYGNGNARKGKDMFYIGETQNLAMRMPATWLSEVIYFESVPDYNARSIREQELINEFVACNLTLSNKQRIPMLVPKPVPTFEPEKIRLSFHEANKLLAQLLQRDKAG